MTEIQNNKRLFGTDGVRGEANRHPITSEVALKLGMAAGAMFRNHSDRSRIVIGKDTRLSGYILESALMSGICAMGTDVYLVGPMPTPAIAFITRTMRADAGIVISASHNPYQDNGIKFFGADGRKLPDDREVQLEKIADDEHLDRPTHEGVGRAYRLDDAEGRYIEYAKNTIPKGMVFDGLKMVVDCANGAAYVVAPTIFEELGAKVITIGVSPDGLNINDGCGSTYPEQMVKKVLEEGADVGLALDGDGDRAIFCDSDGNIIDGDDVLYICASYALQNGELPENTIVGTEMTNMGLVAALREMGVDLKRSAVGDRYVLEEMLKSGSVMGGEPSGHLIFLDHSTTGDGIITALQVVKCMVETGSALGDLKTGWKRYPQVLVNLRVSEKVPLGDLEWLPGLLESARSTMGKDQLLNVRYSGTEPVLRLTVSCESEEIVESVSNELCEKLAEGLGSRYPDDII